MLFKDLLNKLSPEIREEFQSIFENCKNKQFHDGDLLLWKENGSYQELFLDFDAGSGKKFSPYVIGPGIEGISDMTHYEFINQYRQTNISKNTITEYLEQVTYSPDRIEEIDELVLYESTSIQIEMLVYLKFWESDLMIKRLYELTRIANGEAYDWHFKISESARAKNCTGTRQDIIRKKVRDKLKVNHPLLSEWITNVYKTQIRNSIAHSNYSISGRIINLNNFIKDDPAFQLHHISFEEWHEIFHKTILLHNQLIWLLHTTNDYYAKRFLDGENIFIKTPKIDDFNNTLELEYREKYKVWNYKNK